MVEKADYVIIGSGVAGATIASEILKNRLGTVLMLEAGAPIEMRNKRTWLDYVTSITESQWGGWSRYTSPFLKYHDEQGDYSNLGPKTYRWQLRGGRMFGRGGSTVHWGGWCPRLKPEDFILHTLTGRGVDWPITYDELEPYYLKAENFLGVAGNSKAIDPPRSGKYPFEAPKFSQPDQVVIDAFQKLEMKYGHIPVARNAEPHQGRPSCQTIGTCKYCPIGARYTGDQTLDNLEAKYDSFSILTGAVAKRVFMESEKSAGYVEYVDTTSGVTKRVEGKRFFLCAGTVETTKLLLASYDDNWWKKGLGNNSNHLGRYLTAHPFFQVVVRSDSNPQKLQRELHFPTLGSRHFDSVEEQRRGKMAIAIHYTRPQIQIGDLIASGYSRDQIDGRLQGRNEFSLLGYVEGFGYRENRILPNTDSDLTKIGLPKTRIEARKNLFDRHMEATYFDRLKNVGEAMGYKPIRASLFPQRGDHASGTCRMSSDESKGVVDQNLRIHGTENIFVCSNAVFPSNGASNPTLTLTALALRLGEYLVKAKN